MTLSKIINEYHHEKFRFNQEFSDRVVESISPKLELLEYTVLSSISRDPTEILVRSETGKVHIHLSTRGNSVYCRDSRNLGMTKEQIAEIKRVITGGIL